MQKEQKLSEAEVSNAIPVERARAFAPLKVPLFRNVWLGSLFSNFGQLIQGVGAAWAMTQMTNRADMIVLVQMAATIPLMLGSIATGAIADMYDRRKIALTGLLICLAGAVGLTFFSVTGLLTPVVIVACCLVVGIGSALFLPAWQASVGEQVKPTDLPAAVALNSISYNIARSFGPAIGGVLVAIAGAVAAFAFNAVAYIPLLIVMYLWRRKPEKSRLPPEALGRAIISGVRFIFHSPPIRTVCARIFLLGVMGASVSALMPLTAKDLLHGQANIYGFLLGAFGMGAVGGASLIAWLRSRFSSETTLLLAAVVMGGSMIGVGLSRSVILTCLLLFSGGAAWIISMAICNISIQLSVPRWVTGRALAGFQTALTAGLTIGSWAWGHVALTEGVDIALIASGIGMIATISARFFLKMPVVDHGADLSTLDISEPEVNLDLIGRSGPIVISVEYRVDLGMAREFYQAMQPIQRTRQRTGGYDWSISRDISDPELWTERYQTPTWHDYLRQRSRITATEYAAIAHVQSLQKPGTTVHIRRKLERPFGSVRWTDESPDLGMKDAIATVPQAGSTG